MKTAISVSLGSDVRDSAATIKLLDQTVYLCREGWNGDVQAAIERFHTLDGQVDALGVGGIDLWLHTDHGRHPLYSAQKLVSGLKQTPVVDGSGLKNTLERQIPAFLTEHELDQGRNVLVVSGIDRYGMTIAFFEAGYNVLCGDIGFALGMKFPIRSRRGLARAGRWLTPIVTRLPMSALYPTGEAQHAIEPKYEDWYAWADIIAGDCLYIKRHMPDDLTGKIIVTNTTTPEDRHMFSARGVNHLVTSTPFLGGRTFGTNLFEAGLVAASGLNRPLTEAELVEMIRELDLKPTLHQI